jgi:hypothetical protein
MLKKASLNEFLTIPPQINSILQNVMYGYKTAGQNEIHAELAKIQKLTGRMRQLLIVLYNIDTPPAPPTMPILPAS